MTNSKLHAALQKRLDLVEDQITQACARAGRARADVLLVAVTKSVSSDIAAALHQLGVADLGESRPQELWRKATALADSVRWHQVGHLQTNKIDRTLPLTALIHSVDRLRLLEALEKEAARQQGTAAVLLQVNASREPQKHGFAPEELAEVLSRADALQHVRIRGLMTMAALEDDPEACRPAFALLRQLREQHRDRVPPPHALEHLSMGMSNDFTVAIEEGATIIRVGSILFEGIDD